MADMNEKPTQQSETQAAEELKKAAEASDAAGGCGCGCGCTCGEKPQAEAAEVKAEVDELTKATKALEEANAKAAEHYDLYMRAVAEMDNTRRRCAEDVQKAQKFGIEKFAKNLLPVVDSLEKAIEVSAKDTGALRDGILATHRQLVHALEMSGMRAIDPKGEKFDPNTQQAIAMVPATEGKTAGCVAEVFQRGWMIHDRVLRPAMVSVVQG